MWKLKSTSQKRKSVKRFDGRAAQGGILNGKLARLCRFEQRHLNRSRLWFNNQQLARLLGRTRKISKAENKEWFSGLHERKDCVHFAIETRGGEKYIGQAWLWAVDSFNRKAELRIFIGEGDCLEKGIGTEAIHLLCRYGFNRMKLHKIYAYVHATNSRARRAFEKAGFQAEGLLKEDRRIERQFVDVYLLGKLSDER